MDGEGREMEGPTYKGRVMKGEEGKREREGPPVIMVSPGSRGARIVSGVGKSCSQRRLTKVHRSEPKCRKFRSLKIKMILDARVLLFRSFVKHMEY